MQSREPTGVKSPMNADRGGAGAGATPPAPEIVVVATKKIACDGGGGALGHPKVWYDMAEADSVECKYCDRLFALKGGSQDPG